MALAVALAVAALLVVALPVASALHPSPREVVSMPRWGKRGRGEEEALSRRWPWRWRLLPLSVVALPVAALPVAALKVAALDVALLRA